jgi:hypothetical protein
MPTPSAPGPCFDHIAIALETLADAPAVLVGALGGVPDSGAPATAFRWGCWRFAGGGRIEIIEPRGADGFLHRFLGRHGPGIHHVTFKVPSLAEACARAERLGYAIVGHDDSNPHWQEAFLHPRQALGIVVQFAQASGVANPRRLPLPPGPPAPPSVTIVGLRLRARSEEAADRQWSGVLRGRRREAAGGVLVYRWPASPMRIAVELDATGAEGPLAIEYVGRAGRWPEDSHTALVRLFRPAAAGDDADTATAERP